MTPLAQQVTRELLLPIKHRSINDRAGLLREMADLHCFDVTEAYEAVFLIGSHPVTGVDEPDGIPINAFLPAPKTWIEYHSQGVRTGFHLTDIGGGKAKITVVYDRPLRSYLVGTMDLPQSNLDALETFVRWTTETPDFASLKPRDTPEFWADFGDAMLKWHAAFILSAIAAINTPRVFGRRQHMPHRGLERQLLAKRSTVGAFPLHAWTEIKLEIAAPQDMGAEPSIEAHLTGKRALHFCRAHLRFRNGRIEIVRSHWRGDAALGIKQSRYRLTETKGQI